MNYPGSENKGPDQLHGYREADLRLLLSHLQKAGFLMTRLILCWVTKFASSLGLNETRVDLSSCLNFHRHVRTIVEDYCFRMDSLVVANII